jgi:hypothetical protein
MFIYYVDGKKFTADNYFDIPRYHVSSLDESTPALQALNSQHKVWCEKGRIFHRLTGPGYIASNGTKYFYLNGKRYMNVREWFNNHPEPDLYFDAIGLNETDKVLWFLQN